MKGFLVVLGCFLSASSGAQQIPIHHVAPPDARTTEPLKLVQGLVAFGDGHVLVNDIVAQRLLFFDPTFTSYRVTADTIQTGAAAYPKTGLSTHIFHYLGDSAAFTDMATNSFIVVGPDGTLGRSMAHPRPRDMVLLNQPNAGAPTFDARGRFVYRAGHGSVRSADDPTKRTLDTLQVVRADLEARRVDTVAVITVPGHEPSPEVFKDENGKIIAVRTVNPVPAAPDEWAVLSDGSIAVVRSHDYHIDWLNPDGSSASTPKMPFDWRRLTDADKLAKIDSARRIIDSVNASGHPYEPLVLLCSAGARGESEAAKGDRCVAEHAAGKFVHETVVPTITFVPLSEMLDYVPPIRPSAVKADRDNHIWILPTTTLSAVGGGLLYDVVNKQGEIIERVQLPAGRSVAGFGPNGAVYLLAGDRTTGFTLERTHVVH